LLNLIITNPFSLTASIVAVKLLGLLLSSSTLI